MSKYLVIVESPTKAKTIVGILGKDYEVIPSMGHIVDLPSSRLAIDVENNFTPDYKVISGKEKIIKQIKAKLDEKELVYIATDPDREGEAIGWHIANQLAKSKIPFCRVVFHEITEDALREAFSHPGKIDMNMVDSQTARRVLDRIVGYSLSPLLWKKIVRGLSAGRVQSVALKFIVERENEINSFIPKTTYTIDAKFKVGEQAFSGRLEKYHNKKAIFDTKEEALRCVEELKGKNLSVADVIKKETRRKPQSPHTTSLLQQDAYNAFRFSSQKTMMVAQKLYEGITFGEESVGLITYMRTDSFNVSPKAKEETKKFIDGTYGVKYLAEKEYQYKHKKGAQLAHEAIRPTSILRTPAELNSYLTDDEAKLYELIWVRFVASFMHEAIFENTKLLMTVAGAQFAADGKKLIFDGFLKIVGKEEEIILPQLGVGENVILDDLIVTEHTTKPPARFNDASIVKILEEKGIGRPSTYAPIVSTLLRRNYMKRERGAFFPTDLGIKVNNLITGYFSEIINENFTADMEAKLDEVESGKLIWHKIIAEFYPAFKAKVDNATNVVKKEVEVTSKVCPKCNAPMVIKWSKKGRFLSCGEFPKCKYAESITTEVICPLCKEGKLLERRNKRGQFFYGCTKYPACTYTSRKLPQDEVAETEKPIGPIVKTGDDPEV